MITTQQIFAGIGIIIVVGLFYLGFKNTSASNNNSGSNNSSNNNTKN